jgi:hypothetical protein
MHMYYVLISPRDMYCVLISPRDMYYVKRGPGWRIHGTV